MEKNRLNTLFSAVAVTLVAATACAVPASPEAAWEYFRSFFDTPESIPVTFKYDGRRFEGLGALEVIHRDIGPKAPVRKGKFVCQIDRNLTATFEAAYCAEYSQIEYTLWLENRGAGPSKVLEDLYAYKALVPGAKPRLRGIFGDGGRHYEPYDVSLYSEPQLFRSTGGRPTHHVFPYFDFVHGDGGTLMALGWAGTWEASFAAMSEGTHVMAKTSTGLKTVLMPGERIRTGLVVMLPYKGRDAHNASNRWRAWFLKYNLPRFDGTGKAIKPFATSNFAFDTGLPNSDGSISERSTTWRRTLDKLTEEKVLPNFRWIDAGWYSDPAGKTVPTDWWGTVGSWELDSVKWPGKSLFEANEECRRRGLKVLCWFEPERVTHVKDLCRNYGYKKEWGIKTGRVITNNLGDDECLSWTLGRIVKMMDANGIDMYREDNNSDPARSWYLLDSREAEAFGLPRTGINENKCVQGHYRLWDGIIDYCRRNGKCTFVDSCAGGGGRNDIESMRRGVPLMRSDADRTTISMRLAQTWGFCKWIPFHGSANKEVSRQLDVQMGRGADEYVSRASLLPVFKISGAPTQNKNLDFDLMRRNYNEWKSINHLLLRDFYTLTPWRHHKYVEGWQALAYDAPELGESVILAFRMPKAEEPVHTVKLPFVRPEAVYTLVNADTGEKTVKKGSELREGLALRLDKKRSSVLLRMKRD